MDHMKSKKAALEFANAFAKSLGSSLTQTVASPVSIKVLDLPDASSHKQKPVHVRLTADGSLHGDCFVELYEPQVAALGARILDKPVTDFDAEHADTLLAAISSALPQLTASMLPEFGKFSLSAESVADLAFGGMLVVSLRASVSGLPDIPVVLYFENKLLDDLSSRSVAAIAIDAENVPADTVNLKLVMDVELNVSLRFGQRQLPLRELLELASGSVVELDRQVDDPVELLLDGKLVARGEVVIVDGNYGLRVTDVPQPVMSHFTR
jgi:flagellar motor switch protein FliN/FliY